MTLTLLSKKERKMKEIEIKRGREKERQREKGRKEEKGRGKDRENVHRLKIGRAPADRRKRGL